MSFGKINLTNIKGSLYTISIDKLCYRSQILFHCNVTTVRGRVSAVFWPQLVPQWDSSNSLHSPLWLGAVTLLASDWSVNPLPASHWPILWLVCSVLWSGSGSGQEINGESQLWMSSEKDEGELVYIQFGLILTVKSARVLQIRTNISVIEIVDRWQRRSTETTEFNVCFIFTKS